VASCAALNGVSSTVALITRHERQSLQMISCQTEIVFEVRPAVVTAKVNTA
jgi:hypothetical protein